MPSQGRSLRIALLSVLLPCPLLLAADPQPAKMFRSEGNPILGDGSYYSADAAPLSVDDKLYIYAGHDEPPPHAGGFVMHDYGVFVTSDPSSGKWQLYRGNTCKSGRSPKGRSCRAAPRGSPRTSGTPRQSAAEQLV